MVEIVAPSLKQGITAAHEDISGTLQLETHRAANRGKIREGGRRDGLRKPDVKMGLKCYKSLTLRAVFDTVGQLVVQETNNHKLNPTLKEP